MSMSKKQPVPKTMANYYQKLAMVFWKAGYYLFHAAAHFKLFQLSKDMKKNITPEELQRYEIVFKLQIMCVWVGYSPFIYSGVPFIGPHWDHISLTIFHIN